jgi:hypothetical protein
LIRKSYLQNQIIPDIDLGFLFVYHNVHIFPSHTSKKNM